MNKLNIKHIKLVLNIIIGRVKFVRSTSPLLGTGPWGFASNVISRTVSTSNERAARARRTGAYVSRRNGIPTSALKPASEASVTKMYRNPIVSDIKPPLRKILHQIWKSGEVRHARLPAIGPTTGPTKRVQRVQFLLRRCAKEKKKRRT